MWCVRVQLDGHVGVPPSFSLPVADSIFLRLSLVLSGPATWPLCASDLCTMRGARKCKAHSRIYMAASFYFLILSLATLFHRASALRHIEALLFSRVFESLV